MYEIGRTSIRDLLESKKPDRAAKIIKEAVEKKDMTLETLSIKGIWESCQQYDKLSTNVSEAIVGSSFPKITGAGINGTIMKAYQMPNMIGDELCETIPSSMDEDTLAGVTALEGTSEVAEGMEYNSSTFTEKFFKSKNVKSGRIIDITAETIWFDKSSQIAARAKAIGRSAAYDREKAIVQGVMDTAGATYRPEGVDTVLYSSGNGNLNTSTSFGEAGLTTVRTAFQQIQNDSLDEQFIGLGDRMIVMLPADLEIAGKELERSTLTPEAASNADNFWRNTIRVLTSPFLTAASSTDWWCGYPKEMFRYLEVLPVQTLVRKAGNSDDFKRDILLSTKTRWYGSLAAIDHRYFMKNTA